MKRKFSEIVEGIFISGNAMKLRQEFALADIPRSGSVKLKIDQAANEAENDKPGEETNIRETDEYLIRKFRVLSAITIYGLGYPIDYSKPGVLEKAASLFQGTLLKDHRRSIDEWIGLIKNPAYNTASTPPGVDCEFWVDMTLNQGHIVRGVKTGALNRCSAGLMFTWSKSHPEMRDGMFFDRLGEEVDGQEVRIIVESIENVFEVSLVFYGADHTAIAHSADKKNKTALSQKIENTQEVIMKEKLIKFLRMVKDSYITSRSLSTDVDVEQAVEALMQAFNALADEKANVDREVVRLKSFEAFHADQVTALQADCNRMLNVLNLGGTAPQIQKDMVENATFAQLQLYQKDFQAEMEKKFPAMCPKCGVKMERRSSVDSQPPAPAPERKQTGAGEINYM